MEKKKSYGLLIAGIVLLIAGIVLSIITYSTYEATLSMKLAEDATDEAKALFNAQKLNAQKPYSYSLALTFLAFFITIRGVFLAVKGKAVNKTVDVKRLALAGLFAALSYIGFAVFKIEVPIPGGKFTFHFGNVFCVLAALLLGGFWGGMAGAVGMTIGDLTTTYVTSAPKTFLLKLLIGLIVGLVAHKLFHLDHDHSKKYVTGATIVSAIAGMAFNVVADPVVGYFYKTYLLGIQQDLAKTLAKIGAVSTLVNAVIAVIAATIFYLALRPALKKAGLFIEVE